VKITITIPDPIFCAAETLAAELAISCSELYARAIAEFVEAHNDDAITAKINEVLWAENAELDPALVEMQQGALWHCPW
jgi:hypothetical protein